VATLIQYWVAGGVFSFGFSADSAELKEIRVSEHMIVNIALRKVFAVWRIMFLASWILFFIPTL
jgi:hypothetical protein